MMKCISPSNCDDDHTGMMWQVLDWNEPAINFYKKYGTDLDGQWINCNLQADEIQALLGKVN